MIARSPHLLVRLRLAGAATALLMLFAAPLGAPAESLPPQSGTDAPAAKARSRVPQPSYLEPLNGGEAAGILGCKVIGANGEDLGLITDVIVGRDGQPRAAVIDFGGFLGVGSRKIAVDWNLLQFDPAQRDRKVILALGRREIQGAPEYRADAASAEMVGPPLVGPSGGSDGGK